MTWFDDLKMRHVLVTQLSPNQIFPDIIQQHERHWHTTSSIYIGLLTGIMGIIVSFASVDGAIAHEIVHEIADEPVPAALETEATVTASESRSLTLALQAEDVFARLQGVMDTSAQAAANDDSPAVQMTTCPIVFDGDVPEQYQSATFLYQEQALIERIDQPYRQRFLAITPDPLSDSVQSITPRPPNPEQWTGLCDRPYDDRAIQAEDLGEETCWVFLRSSESGYIGRTPVGGCPTTVRGAIAITNVVVLHDNGMDTWDRGFDADGNQVWGATTTPYQYRWVNNSR